MFQPLDAGVARIALGRPDQLPPWPDLTGPNGSMSWQPWLAQVLAIPDFAAAVQQASPSLAQRARAVCDGAEVSERDRRRVVVAVMRYLLRATGRATPYGLFAGVAPARIDTTGSLRWGSEHRAIVRPSARWLTTVLDRVHTDTGLRAWTMVRANDLLVRRSGRLVLEHRASRTPGEAPVHVQVRATAPIKAALDLAQAPVRWHDLAAKLTAEFDVDRATVESMLAQMVEQRLLLSNLHPPMTTTDPLASLIDRLDRLAADAATDPVTAPHAGPHDVEQSDEQLLDCLRGISEQVALCNHSPAHGVGSRRRLVELMTAAGSSDSAVVGVDLRVDCELSVPHAVVNEAAAAAGALARLGRPASGWASWHRRFLERYGPHALVSVLDVVDGDIGLGYPAGFEGAPAMEAPAFSERDRALLALAQRAALTRQHEIVLDDDALANLAATDTGGTDTGGAAISVQPSTALTVRVHASSIAAADAGGFLLSVVAVSRHAGTTAGRFLDLFDPAERQRMAAAYAGVAPITEGALRAQVCAVTPHIDTADVARAPRVLPHLIPVGEYHDDGPNVIALDDLAVTADQQRLHLVSVSRRRVVEPLVFNAVEQVRHTLPIVRLLTEAPGALGTPCSVFNWGAAADLPFLPAVRYGRTILSPARWRLAPTELPGPSTGWADWDAALAAWRCAHGCPAAVYLGDGDQRIGLDLEQPAHRALLREHLTRRGSALLRASPSSDGDGWLDGHPHELVIPLAAVGQPGPPPRLPRHLAPVTVREYGYLPGEGERCYAKFYCRSDRQTALLTEHLPVLLDRLPDLLGPDARWWFLRYGDPEPHLRLRVIGRGGAAVLGTWARRLRAEAMLTRVQFDTDFPETARFGGPAALAAAEEVFMADSAAVLSQLAAVGHRSAPGLLALTAASMFDLAVGLLGDPAEAMRWLIAHTRAHRPAPPRTIYQHAVQLADPHSRTALRSLLGVEDADRLLSCWDRRRLALAHYRSTLQNAEVIPTTLLPDLLHLHHARMVGINPDSERACLHLARAAALSWTSRSRKGS